MKRFFAVLILILILISVCTFEEIFLQTFVKSFTFKAETLSALISNKTELKENKEINNSYITLKQDWNNAKTTLCFFTNYEKIKSMDESLIKLESAIKNNDKNLANENISLICNYDQFFNYMLGFNLNNLF